MDLDEILVNLKILEHVEKGDKLVTRGQYLNVEPRSLIPECLRRWNRQDNRDETLKKINRLVDGAIKLFDKSHGIEQYLRKAKTGIRNLKTTYSIDDQTVARLDIVLDKINVALNEVDDELVLIE